MCDEFVVNKLIEWGFPDLTASFKDAEIDKEALGLLDEISLKELIPSVGKRLKFKKKLLSMQYGEDKNIGISPSSSSTVTYHSGEITPTYFLDGIISNDNISPTYLTTQEVPSLISITSGNFEENLPSATNTPRLINSDEQCNDKCELVEINPKHRTIVTAPVLPAISITDNVNSSILSTEATGKIIGGRKRKNIPEESEVTNGSSSRKSRIFPNGLRALLSSSIDGRQLLERQKEFDTKCRQILSKIIVDHLLNESFNGRISTETFIDASNEIIKIFPREDAKTYYIPYKPRTQTSPKLPSKGRLWSRYINFKRVSLSSSADVENKCDDDQSSSDVIASEEVEQYLNILKVSVEPLEEIKKGFDITFKKRLAILESQAPHEYLNLFPSLKLPDGYKLLIEDFNREYPHKENSLYILWPSLSKAVIELVKTKNIHVDAETDDLDISAIKYLPLLFGPYTVRTTKKGKSFRPSKLEMQESFLLHIQTRGELQNKIEIRETKLRDAGLPLQPFMIIVGKLDNIQGCYVAINQHLYAVPTPLTSLDVCFKLFFALKTQYPSECKHIWSYIQQYIYNIKTPWDIEYPSVSTIAKEIENSRHKVYHLHLEYLWYNS